MKPQRAKGLTDKWVVYLRSPQEQKENDYAYKIDYAYDAEGRLQLQNCTHATQRQAQRQAQTDETSATGVVDRSSAYAFF